MDIKKRVNQTSKDLQLLLRLSIAGIFIVGGMGYVFNNLMNNLEDMTKTTQLKLDIIKKVESKTLDAKYDFIKALSFIEKKNYKSYKLSSIQKVQESNRYLKVLLNGGEIKIGRYNQTKIYEPDTIDKENIQLAENRLDEAIQKYFPIFEAELTESIESADIDTILSIQELIALQSKDIVELFTDRINKLNDISDRALIKLQSIEKEIENKKKIYFYAQIITLIFILISLIVSSKPIRRQILNSSLELEEASLKATQASIAKSEFLANMSHEIRTPLNAILGFIDLLREQERDKEKLKYIDTIHNSSNTLLGIINDILDFSKIESGSLSIDMVDFNVESEFKTIIELFRARASEKNINLKLVMHDNIPAALHSDPLRIKQIIANLLSNAIKFTPQNGSVTLYIGYKDRQLQVAVKDTGIGVPKDKQELIFKAFSQAESSTTRKFGGTGLGLSISVRLVEMLGGKLEIKSEDGKGSIFYFSINAEIGKYKRELTKNGKNTKEIGSHRVLLVEDNKANQMFMSIILKKLKLEFDIANDGLEAIKAFNSKQYDLILMDENMPNLNGIEATKKILKIEKEKNLDHTPIIALTANALKGDRERFLEAGMDEYLTKPINKEKLASTIDNFITDREMV
jgi:signal transduction histidine kinase/ActR/RegA family two-component response regulator